MYSHVTRGEPTRGGREPMPTYKAKHIVRDQLADQLKELSKAEFRAREDLLIKTIDGLPSSSVHRSYQLWCDLIDQFLTVEERLRPYLDGDDLRLHDKVLKKAQEQQDEFRRRINVELSRRTSPPRTGSSAKSLRAESMRLKREIDSIEQQLSRVSMSAPPPRRPASDPGGPMVGNPRFASSPRHPAPSRPSASTTFAHPLANYPGPTTSTVRPRSADDNVLRRLADILENKQDRLPKMEPEVFHGDLLKYPMWIRAFEALIERRTDSCTDRLFFLGKYTAGEAHDCIAGYLSLFSVDAYDRARDTLRSRYGDRVKVAEAYRRKLFSWSSIKKGDGKELRRLADFLWQCNAAMETVGHLQALNSAEEINRIMKLLPTYLGEKWDRIVDKWYYGEDVSLAAPFVSDDGCYPPFPELCKFLSKEARILNGPGKGLSDVHAESDTKSGQKSSRKTHTLATGNREQPADSGATRSRARREDKPKTPPVCYYCSGAHVIGKCPTYCALSGERRKQFAVDNLLCFGCLSKSHGYTDCRRKRTGIFSDATAAPTAGATAMKTAVIDEECSYYAMTLPVEVYHEDCPGRTLIVYASLDTQSDSCFVSDELVEKLDVPTTPTSLELVTMGASQRCQSSIVSRLRIRGLLEQHEVLVPRAYTRDVIPGDRGCIPRPEHLRSYPHLRDIVDQMPAYQPDAPIAVLLGFNCPEAVLARDQVLGTSEQPSAVFTSLGWGAMGRAAAQASQQKVCFTTATREVLTREFLQVFDRDFMDVPDSDQKCSQDDKRFLDVMKESLRQLPDGRYSTRLPFRAEPALMPDNRGVALKRLNNLKRRFERDQAYYEKYRDFIDDLLRNGYAELAPEHYREGQVCYSPHHGVTHPRKPDKLRVVKNFSSEKDGVSLNKLLLQGPDLTNNLVGVLNRFREHPVAFMCDIKGMFLRIEVEEEDRDYLRFLWYEDGDPKKKVIELRMTAHPFGATSSPTCANYVLQAAAKQHGHEFDAETVEFILRGFYVDDGLRSLPSDEQVIRLFTQAHELCARGGFWLHKFVCNSPSVLAQIPEDLLDKSLKTIDFRNLPLPVETSLGLKWEMDSDTFVFIIQELVRELTRRGMLSRLSSVFDPIGLIAPVILAGRIVLQSICTKNVGWDDPVPEEAARGWTSWISGLQDLTRLHVPRCYRRTVSATLKSAQLHHFCDASTHGYGACSYLRLEDDTGAVDVTLVASKARVTPRRAVTIPRLELQSAVTAVKLSVFLQREMSFPEATHHFWSDSRVALGYITNESRRFHLFVHNRVHFIREHTTAEQWRHVKGALNPADLASRGCEAAELIERHDWWFGPEFVKDDVTQTTSCEEFDLDLSDPEIKRSAIVNVVLKDAADDVLSRLSGVGNWVKLVNIIARCRDFGRRLLARARLPRPRPPLKPSGIPTLSVAQREEATVALVRLLQRQAYPEVLAALEQVRGFPESQAAARARNAALRATSNLYKLDVYVDGDDVMRVGGRIRRSDMPFELKHPVILPKNHPVVELLIDWHHRRLAHPGRQSTLGAIRGAGYWIVSCRSTIDRVIRRCTICRRRRGTTMTQKMADLPRERILETAPFTYCGVDVFGPFTIKEGRAYRKRWICMFTCFSCRGAHVEPLAFLSTESFMSAFRRFTSRRGPIRALYSDRGTNFVGAANERQQALLELDHATIQEELLKYSCDWFCFNFNVPKASHMGGVWERMIRSLRSVLTELLSKHSESLNDELFHTFLAETEAIVNSRPLAPADIGDPLADPPITPAQLLTLKSVTALPPPGVFPEENLYGYRRWRRVQYLADQFWRRWRRDFLPTLQARQKWNDLTSDLQLDDVVVMMDDQLPRAKWPLARVVALLPSPDGLVRKATLRTQTGTYDRPITKIIFLNRPDDPSVFAQPRCPDEEH